jgi:hypothetical protein
MTRLAVTGFGALLLLGAALVNGYPLVFYDSGDYIAMSFSFEPIVYRTIPYALFLRATHWGLTLWLPVIVQALLAAWVTVTFLAAFGMRRPPYLLTVLALLALLTPVAWFAGQLMPDIFAGLGALALITLALDVGMSRGERAALVVLAVVAGIVHLSHMALLCGLFACLALFRLAGQRVLLALPALAVVLSLLLPPAINRVLAGRWFYSEAGPVFLFARLVQDGIAQDYLNKACLGAEQRYSLCDWRGVLPATANDLLWNHDSVVATMGGWRAVRDDAARVVNDSLIAMPWRHVTAAVANFAEQFVTFRSGEGLDVNQWEDSRTMVWQNFPADGPGYRDSLQQAERLGRMFAFTTPVEVATGFAGMVLLPVLAAWAWRRDRRLALALVLLLLTLMGNAAICGILSNPTDRYQGRIIWLAPLGVLLAWPARRSAQNTMRLSSAVGSGAQPARGRTSA